MILRGNHVQLEQLDKAHIEGLKDASRDGELWKLGVTSVPHPDEMAVFVDKTQAKVNSGHQQAFVIRRLDDDRVIGCTRYYDIMPSDRRLKIGYTWYAKSAQRTAANTECKLLLLKRAFEDMKQIAVEFRTHIDNAASRRAIARLGAKQDGILRNHMILADGSIRDTVCFSIIDSEWPDVRAGLEARLVRN